MDNPFTMQELMKVKKGLKNSKSPGNDGLNNEFYKACWKFIAPDILDTLNEIFLSGSLPRSMTQGVTSLVYKNKGTRDNLKFWRPISLLNTDYKIMTRTIATRLEPYLPRFTRKPARTSFNVPPILAY